MSSHTDRIIIEEFNDGESFRIYREKTGQEICGMTFKNMLNALNKMILEQK